MTNSLSRDLSHTVSAVTSGQITIAEILAELRSGYWSRMALVAEDAADTLQDLFAALKRLLEEANEAQAEDDLNLISGSAIVAASAAISRAEGKS